MGKNNYPQAGLDEIPAEDIQKISLSLKELHDLGRPETDFEVEDRIDKYFSFCIGAGLRPGIEGLGLALHVSRTTLFNWERGINCSLSRANCIMRKNKSTIRNFSNEKLAGLSGCCSGNDRRK